MNTETRYVHFLRFYNGRKVDSFWVAASGILAAIATAEQQPLLPGESIDWDFVALTFDQMDEYVWDEKACVAIYA